MRRILHKLFGVSRPALHPRVAELLESDVYAARKSYDAKFASDQARSYSFSLKFVLDDKLGDSHVIYNASQMALWALVALEAAAAGRE